ncbi:MAG: ATP-binding protein [Euryarchaeota archaeon]|nr:ATP-binding protein [Euryarchaeota archaeon]
MHVGSNRNTDKTVELPSSVLNKHVAMLGATGSGKTVAAKVLIEEATLDGIPSIIVDPQGDLARLAIIGDRAALAENGGDAERSRLWEEKAEVRIWTPTRQKGLPICLDPFSPPTGELDAEALVSSWDLMASGFAVLAGHDVEKKSPGGQIKAFLNELLTESARLGCYPHDFVSLSELVVNPGLMLEEGAEPARIAEIIGGYIKDPVREELARRFNALDSGVNQLLFSLGVPMDIETLLEPAKNGKVPVNIFYLKSLGSEDLRQSFLQELGRRLYDWMLNQSTAEGETKLLFFIDEVSKYLPSDPRQPPAKQIIKLLFEQGRKYGLSCALATQSVANVDYKILGQANTIFIGRFQTKQDRGKIADLLKVGGADLGLVDELPSLEAGEFQIVCPDISKVPIQIKTRWLYTDHGATLGENEVEALTPQSLRDWAKERSVAHSHSANPPAIPLSRKQMSKGMTENETPFESHLMGGLMLLKDPKDPLSVMLGATNLFTALVLLTTTYLLGQSWIDGENLGLLLIFGSLLSLVSCVALVVETLLSDERALVQRIRKRARPIQYLILIWIWILWFGNRAAWFDLSWASILIDIAQTLSTLFVLLEMAHRIRLGNLQLQLDWNPLAMMKEAVHSMKLLLSESEIAVMRATSNQVMQSLQFLTEIVTACLLGLLLFEIGDFTLDSTFSSEIVLRLFSIYALQITAKVYVNFHSK